MTQLAAFNRALMILGESPLTDLDEAEDREAGRVLLAIWDDGAVKACLEQGQWNFAIRSSLLEYNPSITPSFGYNYAFDMPDDWVRWAAICIDSRYRTPYDLYQIENDFLFCDQEQLYVRYVSDDTSYGFAYGLWPESFKQYVGSYLAARACYTLGKNENTLMRAEEYMRNCKYDARNKDILQEPSRTRQAGSVVRARRNSRWGS